MAKSRIGKALLRIGVAALALVVALLVAEHATGRFDIGGVRYQDEVMRYRVEAAEPRWQRPDGSLDLDGVLHRHRPHLDIDFGTHVLRTNALGLRGPEVTVPKPDGACRVLVLGDSVVYGWGVDDEVTFVRALERRLRARDPRAEVVNAGHLLYDTVQEAALLEEIGDVLAPDLVLLVYVVNDIEPTRDLVETLLGIEREPDPPMDVPPETRDVWVRTADLLEPRFPHLSRLARVRADQSKRYAAVLERHGGVWIPEVHGSGPRGWRRSREALLAIRDWCAARDVPLLVLDHSYPAIRALPDFCREHGIDLAPFAFTDEEQRLPIRNSAIDSHANARGHELLLGKSIEALDARGLPDCAGPR